jgi:hypothetical protein
MLPYLMLCNWTKLLQKMLKCVCFSLSLSHKGPSFGNKPSKTSERQSGTLFAKKKWEATGQDTPFASQDSIFVARVIMTSSMRMDCKKRWGQHQAGIMCIADGGYEMDTEGKLTYLCIPSHLDSCKLQNFKSRAHWCHESLNGRLNNFKILKMFSATEKHVMELLSTLWLSLFNTRWRTEFHSLKFSNMFKR